MAKVFIGVDPHKLSATIEVVDDKETVLAKGRFAMDKVGYLAMRKTVSGWPYRVSDDSGYSTAIVETVRSTTTLSKLRPPSRRTFSSSRCARMVSPGPASRSPWLARRHKRTTVA